MSHRITLLPGDGIGREVSAAVLRVIEGTGVEVEWDRHTVSSEAVERAGSTLPEEALESVRMNKVALKGPVTTPIGTGFESVNVRLRKSRPPRKTQTSDGGAQGQHHEEERRALPGVFPEGGHRLSRHRAR